MLQTRTRETPSMGDFAVAAISPIFVASLVGSLVFFLLDVFYNGQNAEGIRWMMFWYVIAIVAVARISLDRGKVIANVYGLALAATTWLYMSSAYQNFMLGIFLLAFTWWCAHRLVMDSSNTERLEHPDTSKKSSDGILGSLMKLAPVKNKTIQPKLSRKAGIWIVCFSIAAIPVFGIGKVLLPESDTQLRSRAGVWLTLYLVSALMLLISTRFLNVRQTLRKRRKKMPTKMAVHWFYSGVLTIFMVGLIAWLSPRPGSTRQWTQVSESVNLKIRDASQWAMKWNPEGTGEGMEKNLADRLGESLDGGIDGNEQNQGQGRPVESGSEGRPNNGDQSGRATQSNQNRGFSPSPGNIQWLQWLFWITVILLVIWMIYKNRALLVTLLREWWTALSLWLKQFRSIKPKNQAHGSPRRISTESYPKFKSFINPFSNASAKNWEDARIICYTMEAFQAWLNDQRIPHLPCDTAAEQMEQWQRELPEAYDALHYLYGHYTHAGYGNAPRSDFSREPLKDLWTWMQGT